MGVLLGGWQSNGSFDVAQFRLSEGKNVLIPNMDADIFHSYQTKSNEQLKFESLKL